MECGKVRVPLLSEFCELLQARNFAFNLLLTMLIYYYQLIYKLFKTLVLFRLYYLCY